MTTSESSNLSLLNSLFSFCGQLGRGPYLRYGLTLVIVKVNLDRVIAALFGLSFHPFNYIFGFSLQQNPALWSSTERTFIATLILASVPFALSGLALTSRRLRDLGWPRWLSALFFVPGLNLLFFVLLSLLPGVDQQPSGEKPPRLLVRLIPHDPRGSACLAVFLTALFLLFLGILSVLVLGDYGAALFLGAPFYCGLAAALLASVHHHRSARECTAVAISSIFLGGGLLVAFAIEGLVCLIMALPLALPLSIAGGYLGYVIQNQLRRAHSGPTALCSIAFCLPLLLLVEFSDRHTPELRKVSTTMVIDAPQEVVWEHVISFADLEPPQELIFKFGIAYPQRARIEGAGVGAIRRCEFSTGAFVEPITAWDQPHRLAFSVTEQPAPMIETSPWGPIMPKHIDGYLSSERGEFVLDSVSPTVTRLTGTTWYRNNVWPTAYWYLWSDYLIHTIHKRVLAHIGQLAETAAHMDSNELARLR